MNAEVTRLLPHRAPALLVASLESISETSAKCRGRIPADSPFALGQKAPSVVGLELGAQAAAALEGVARAAAGEGAVGAGFVVGMRDVRLHSSELPVEVDLDVLVERVESAPPLRTYRVEVSSDGEVAVAGTVSTWSQD